MYSEILHYKRNTKKKRQPKWTRDGSIPLSEVKWLDKLVCCFTAMDYYSYYIVIELFPIQMTCNAGGTGSRLFFNYWNTNLNTSVSNFQAWLHQACNMLLIRMLFMGVHGMLPSPPWPKFFHISLFTVLLQQGMQYIHDSFLYLIAQMAFTTLATHYSPGLHTHTPT